MPVKQPKQKFKLTDKLITLIIMALKTFGTYDPDKCLIGVEEYMTGQEYETAAAFLRWAHANGVKFGRGNIHAVFEDFLKGAQ